MEFFDQRDSGQGAKIFFMELQKQCLCDVLAKLLKEQSSGLRDPLSVSHILPNGTERRYDFVFAKNNFGIEAARYHYAEAVKASSDHALIEADLYET